MLCTLDISARGAWVPYVAPLMASFPSHFFESKATCFRFALNRLSVQTGLQMRVLRG